MSSFTTGRLHSFLGAQTKLCRNMLPVANIEEKAFSVSNVASHCVERASLSVLISTAVKVCRPRLICSVDASLRARFVIGKPGARSLVLHHLLYFSHGFLRRSFVSLLNSFQIFLLVRPRDVELLINLFVQKCSKKPVRKPQFTAIRPSENEEKVLSVREEDKKHHKEYSKKNSF